MASASERISDDEIEGLERRIAAGQTTAMDVDLLRLIIDQAQEDVAERS